VYRTHIYALDQLDRVLWTRTNKYVNQ